MHVLTMDTDLIRHYHLSHDIQLMWTVNSCNTHLYLAQKLSCKNQFRSGRALASIAVLTLYASSSCHYLHVIILRLAIHLLLLIPTTCILVTHTVTLNDSMIGQLHAFRMSLHR